MGSLFRYTENSLLVCVSRACYIQLFHPSNLASLKPASSAFSNHYTDVIPEDHTLTVFFFVSTTLFKEQTGMCDMFSISKVYQVQKQEEKTRQE